MLFYNLSQFLLHIHKSIFEYVIHLFNFTFAIYTHQTGLQTRVSPMTHVVMLSLFP